MSLLVDPQGKPVSSKELDICPKCGGGPGKRGPSSGFGEPWTVCSCGYEFKDKPFNIATPTF